MKIIDGYMPFKGLKTYYRIVDGGDKTPLICLHGGQDQHIIILKYWIVLPRQEEK